MFKTEPFRFFYPQVGLADGANLPRKTEFADDNRFGWKRDAQMVADDGERNGQIRPGVVDFEPAGDACENVGVADGNAAEFVEERQNDGQAFGVDSGGDPLRDGVIRLIHQGLRFKKHGAGTFDGAADGTAGRVHIRGVKKYLARVGHADKPAGSHFEYADFIRCAKTVFDGSQNPVLIVAVAFKIGDGIDHVFQNPGASDLPILGHVPDEDGNAI